MYHHSSAFLDRWKLTFFQEFGGSFLWGILLVTILRPRKSTSCTPKWQFAMLSLSPGFLRQWETARKFMINCWGVLAALPILSTYCAHWLTLITGSRYLQMKLEKADRERLSMRKIYSNSWMQGVRLIVRRPFECSDTLGNNQVCRTIFSHPNAALHPLVYLPNGCF